MWQTGINRWIRQLDFILVATSQLRSCNDSLNFRTLLAINLLVCLHILGPCNQLHVVNCTIETSQMDYRMIWIIIPANFFWDISVRFLSWQCREFWTRHDHFRRFPTKSEVFQRSPKTSEVLARSLPVLFPSKIRDSEEIIVIYSFSHGFRSLHGLLVWVNIFLEIVSNKTATTHIFQSGVRNWPASVRRREIEVFNQVLKAWELAGIWIGWQGWKHVSEMHSKIPNN